MLINAIDDPEASMQLTELVQETFPNLKIVARARDVDHYIRLRRAGIEHPEHETFESALRVGRMALEGLGVGRYEARERADLFRRYNQQMVEDMVDGASDTLAQAAAFKRTSALLTTIINEDRSHLSVVQRHGWQGTAAGVHVEDIAPAPERTPPVKP